MIFFGGGIYVGSKFAEESAVSAVAVSSGLPKTHNILDKWVPKTSNLRGETSSFNAADKILAPPDTPPRALVDYFKAPEHVGAQHNADIRLLYFLVFFHQKRYKNSFLAFCHKYALFRYLKIPPWKERLMLLSLL